MSVDFSFSVKELYGQNQFPLAVARSAAKVTGKAKLARRVVAAAARYGNHFPRKDRTEHANLSSGKVPAGAEPG